MPEFISSHRSTSENKLLQLEWYRDITGMRITRQPQALSNVQPRVFLDLSPRLALKLDTKLWFHLKPRSDLREERLEIGGRRTLTLGLRREIECLKLRFVKLQSLPAENTLQFKENFWSRENSQIDTENKESLISKMMYKCSIVCRMKQDDRMI